MPLPAPQPQNPAPEVPEAPRVLHSPGGIRGRWMLNALSFVLVFLGLLITVVAVSVSAYYYSSAQGALMSVATQTADTYRRFFTDNREQYMTQAQATVLTFEQKEQMELQFLDLNARVQFSTSALTLGGTASTEDARNALTQRKAATFTGDNPQTDERVMSITVPLLSSAGDLIGGVRVISSMRLVDRQIAILLLSFVGVCLAFLVLVVASNSFFVKSIVDPVLKVNTIAKEIAAGRYGVQLQKTYDDEIGELCDTINYMSDEICRAERMKNDFISSVSHELRTPLTAIGGWSETLLAGGGEDPVEVMQGLSIIQKESARLTRMVEELLDFARIESGRLKLEVEPFDLSVELYEAVYMYQNLLRKSGLTLDYTEQDEQSYVVNGDRHRIKQVFLNILDNAAKYGADGGRIAIELRREGDRIITAVRDCGVGIPEDELPFVKERFYKGSSKQRGSGIGLAVTDEIVRLHGGTLELASTVGEGTTVTVSIPAVSSGEPAGLAETLPAEVVDAPLS